VRFQKGTEPTPVWVSLPFLLAQLWAQKCEDRRGFLTATPIQTLPSICLFQQKEFIKTSLWVPAVRPTCSGCSRAQCLHSCLPGSWSNWIPFLSAAPLWHGQGRWFHQIYPLGRGSWHRVYHWWHHRGHPCHSATGPGGEVAVHPEGAGSGQANGSADGTGVRVHHQNPRHQRQRTQVPGWTLRSLCSRNVTCG